MLSSVFFAKAPSFEAREAHWYYNNWLGILCARGGGLLDHPYAPRHPSSAPPTGERQWVNSQTTGIRWVVMANVFYFSVVILCVISHDWVFRGCCINLFISFTDHVMSGRGIWFSLCPYCWAQLIFRWWETVQVISEFCCRLDLIGTVLILS